MNNFLQQYMHNTDFCDSLYHVANNQMKRRRAAYYAIAIFEADDLYNEIIIALDSAPCSSENDMIDYAYRFCERLAKNGNDKMLTRRRTKKDNYKRHSATNIDVVDLTCVGEDGEIETDDEVMGRLVYSGKGRYV